MEPIGFSDIQSLARQESSRLHHYFIGVEHLFIALTKLRGGLTAAVLEEHGLSPRFVRHSIREIIEPYQDPRYWVGFPETPRTVRVLEMAQSYAGHNTPSERDLLMAILDEGDSVVIRVLAEMDVDLVGLRETAASLPNVGQVSVPEVPILGQVELTPDQRYVLQQMFRSYGQVQTVRELTGGYSGARILLVRPVRDDGRHDAAVVVKLDDRDSVLYERRRYDLHVKDRLPPKTARLVDFPTAPDGSAIGGLKYTFVGRLEDSEPVNLREYASHRSVGELHRLIREVFEFFGPNWWLQREQYRFGVWREYEHVLPPALVIDVLADVRPDPEGHVLEPFKSWSRLPEVMPGEIVTLSGLTVQKLHPEQGRMQLAAGSQSRSEAVNRCSKVEVRGLDLSTRRHFRGEVVEALVGRVILTRDDLLMRSVQDLEPQFSPFMKLIPSRHPALEDLPNPLLHVSELLERQIQGFLSTIHGDLHLGNILVGPNGDAWLIDFGWTREGHTLFDWAMLETSLLVEIGSRRMEPGWDGVWNLIALIEAINRGDDRVLHEDHPAVPVLSVVWTVRQIVQECLAQPDRWDEYFIALALIALRVLDWQSETIDGRRLAFLIAALAMKEAQKPFRTDGGDWPDLTQTDLRTGL